MTFTINNKQYNSVPFEFETMCQFEERGIEAEEIGNKKTFSVIKAYFSMCSGLPDVIAGQEINSHVINGGDFVEIREVMEKEMDKSDFINAILNRAKNTEVSQTEETSKEKSENTKA